MFAKDDRSTSFVALCATIVALFAWSLVAYGNESQAPGGAVIYASSGCATCHMADGRGDRSAGTPGLRSPSVQKKTDVELGAVISHGRRSMPSFERTLQENDVAQLVQFVRTLRQPRIGSRS